MVPYRQYAGNNSCGLAASLKLDDLKYFTVLLVKD